MVSGSDLTGFAALLGESLTSRVDLLERLLRESHYPSLGQYKERLLAETIRSYLPTSVHVGTGFVIFPREDEERAVRSAHFDPLNQSSYEISRQCDVLIYDTSRHPVIFKDGDFVVVRPEAVRAVIEVKGSLDAAQLNGALASFQDFGVKWRRTQLFYKSRHQHATSAPGIYLMAWQIRDRGGRRSVRPERLRRMIADHYAANVPVSTADGFPFLTQLMIHNECEISAVHGIDNLDTENFSAQFGWASRDGRFVRIGPDGVPYRDKDRTIASMLASLHWKVAREDFNRFFSYTDEIRHEDALPYPHRGVDWAYTGVPMEQARHLTAEQLLPTSN